MNWEFQYAVATNATPQAAWRFWSDVRHWAFDDAIEWVEIDGPFRKGARGRTKPAGRAATDWELAEVRRGRRAVIEMPLPGALARFTWGFEARPEGGTRIVQHVRLDGPDVETYAAEALEALAQGIRDGMARLAAEIERHAGTEAGADEMDEAVTLEERLEEAQAEGIVDAFDVSAAGVEIVVEGQPTVFTRDGARAFVERMLRLTDARRS